MAQRANSVASNTSPLSTSPPIEEDIGTSDDEESYTSDNGESSTSDDGESYTSDKEDEEPAAVAAPVAALIAATKQLLTSAPITRHTAQPIIRSAASVASSAGPSPVVAPPIVVAVAATPTAVPTGQLYAANYVPPSKPPNAVAPRPDLVTPIYGYHLLIGYTSGQLYVIIRGLNIGIFDNWDEVASLTLHVKGNVQRKVKTMAEAHRAMRTAINNGYALYLSQYYINTPMTIRAESGLSLLHD